MTKVSLTLIIAIIIYSSCIKITFTLLMKYTLILMLIWIRWIVWLSRSRIKKISAVKHTDTTCRYNIACHKTQMAVDTGYSQVAGRNVYEESANWCDWHQIHYSTHWEMGMEEECSNYSFLKYRKLWFINSTRSTVLSIL